MKRCSEYVISRYRDSNSNLRTQAHRIIERAGFTPWPKVFQNLRSSLATDLVQYEALHVVAQWTGHTVETMRKFYLQVTKEHRQNAKRREKEAKSQQSEQQAEAESQRKHRESRIESFRQVAAESAAVTVRNGETERVAGEDEEGVLSIRNFALSRFDRRAKVAAEGLEPPTRGLSRSIAKAKQKAKQSVSDRLCQLLRSPIS